MKVTWYDRAIFPINEEGGGLKLQGIYEYISAKRAHRTYEFFIENG